jgi:hypothetical protein
LLTRSVSPGARLLRGFDGHPTSLAIREADASVVAAVCPVAWYIDHVWRLALWGLLATGCDRVLQLVEVKDGRVEADGPTVDALIRPVGCPADYDTSLPSSASYYRKLPMMNWQAAAAACASDRMVAGAETHLIVLSNDSERAESALSMGAIEWWIGYSDLKGPDDAFRWVTAENTNGYPVNKQIPWDSDQPDAVVPACGEVRDTGQLHDASCSDLDVSLCECDAFSDVPANR